MDGANRLRHVPFTVVPYNKHAKGERTIIIKTYAYLTRSTKNLRDATLFNFPPFAFVGDNGKSSEGDKNDTATEQLICQWLLSFNIDIGNCLCEY
jgi:hypothetical protein